MDAVSVIKEIVAAVQYLQEVHAVAKKVYEGTADMLGRLLAITPNLDSIEGDLQRGLFETPGQLQALLRLNDAVQAAEKLVSKLSGTKRGGVVAWAQGAWNAKSNMQQLEEVGTRIDRAVQDLTLSEVRRGFVHQGEHNAEMIQLQLEQNRKMDEMQRAMQQSKASFSTMFDFCPFTKAEWAARGGMPGVAGSWERARLQSRTGWLAARGWKRAASKPGSCAR